MLSGQLRHRVMLQRPTTSDNAYGESEISWSNVRQVWAEIRTISGTERFDRNTVDEEITHNITIRWTADIDSSWRVIAGTRTYNIVTIDEGLQQPKSHIILMVKERR